MANNWYKKPLFLDLLQMGHRTPYQILTQILLLQKFYQNLKTPQLKLPAGKSSIYKLQLSDKKPYLNYENSKKNIKTGNLNFTAKTINLVLLKDYPKK